MNRVLLPRLRPGLAPLLAAAALLGAFDLPAARISEPDTVLYGRVIERVGNREFPITSGVLVWNLRTTGPGARDLRLSTRLERLADGRFSYRLRIPHAVLAYDLTVKAGAVGLSGAGTRVQHVAVTLDGRPLAIAASAVDGFALDQSRRASTQRVDLEIGGDGTDTDGDGSPDWWEDQNGFDKYDPADAPGEGNPAPATGTGPAPAGVTTATAPPGTFAAWRAAWFPGATGDLEFFGQQDADGDGVSNFLEYAFDLDPSRADDSGASGLPRAVHVSGRGGVAFHRRAGATDLVYQVETSADLFRWSSDPGELEELPASTSSSVRTVLSRTSADEAAGHRFFRVRVDRR
jgi:hypothetical protein